MSASQELVVLAVELRPKESRRSPEFSDAIEAIVHREVIAFASAIDPENDVVYESFSFARVSAEANAES